MSAPVLEVSEVSEAPAAGGEAAEEPQATTRPSRWNRLTDPGKGLGIPLLAAVGLLVVILLRNRQIFTIAIFEDGDPAANSLLVDEAKRFRLLVGNRSRVGFNHPGPGFLYVQAWGEVLFRDVLRIVPAPYNGQLLGVVVLNCALFGLLVRIVQVHLRSLLATVTFAAALFVFLALQPVFFPASSWMPAMYVLPFATFCVATTSLLAEGPRFAWVFVVTGGLLVHGHVSFLLFVGGLTALVLMCLVARRRHDLGAALRANIGRLAVCAGIASLFALPIVLGAATDPPGEFGRYLDYVRTREGQANGLSEAVDYVEFYWSSDTDGSRVLLAALVASGVALASAVARRPKRFLLALQVTALAATALLLLYAVRGIDLLSETYIGWFYFSVPALLAAGAAAGAVLLAVRTRVASTATVALICVLVLWASTRSQLSSPYRGSPAQAEALELLTDSAGERPLVLEFGIPAWPPGLGLLEAARRADVNVCLASPFWAQLTSGRELCSAAELAGGLRVQIEGPGSDPVGALLSAPDMVLRLPAPASSGSGASGG